jgi:hypothetical protein
MSVFGPTLLGFGGGVTPSTPPRTTGYLTVYDEDGNAEEGCIINVKAVQVPTTDTGHSYDDTIREIVSDADGLVQVPNLVKGLTYFMWRGTSKKRYPITIPTTADDTYALPSIIGGP